MKFCWTMKIVEFFLIIWGKWSELEPEPEFLTRKKWTGSATLLATFAMLRNRRTNKLCVSDSSALFI
jgi:hypothetical protein